MTPSRCLPLALIVGCVLCLLGIHVDAEQHALNIERLGSVLGYPASALTSEDVTDEQRKVHSMPTVIEHQRGEKGPYATGNFIAAYRVTGKTPFSFYPVLIIVAREGTFLSAETQKNFDSLAGLPNAAISEGGRGPFGRFEAGELGFGGLLLGKLRIPSTTKEMDYPSWTTALLSDFRLPGKHVDIRIAIAIAFSNGNPLVRVPGGERYFENWSSQESQDTPGVVKPAFDLRECFIALNIAVVESPLLVSIPHSTVHPSSQADPPTNQANSNPSTALATTTNPFGAKPTVLAPYLWIGVAILLLVAGWFILRASKKTD